MSRGIEFNPDELTKRYQLEREKRLREDGAAQYQELDGAFEHLKLDIFADPNYSRPPIASSVSVLIVGGGYGGLLVAVKLIEKGVQDFCIIEKGGSYGGTWYWNQYPGARCDVESYIYMPLLEELGYIPAEKYATGTEILQHINMISKRWNLTEKTHFQTEVKDMTWDDVNSHWIVHTNSNDTIHARYVVTATGILHKPKLPGLPGMTSFKGHSFHTSRWDYEYTGGRENWKLTGLRDRRVAIIGTGATSIQIVPFLAQYSQHLYVFQRTPSTVSVRNNYPTDSNFSSHLKPGWQRSRMENFNAILAGETVEEDLVNDGWTEMKWMAPPDAKTRTLDPIEMMKVIELIDFQKMEAIRARVDSIVGDKQTAEKLKPWYQTICKRPCFHDEYLQSFNLPNCTLVDTDGKGVEKITETSIVANGHAYEVDLIVYSTGFESPIVAYKQNGIDIRGRGGQLLDEKWSEGVSTLYGLQSRDFPNYFGISTLQAGVTANFVYTLDAASKHIAYVISQCERKHVKTVEPTAEAEQAWVNAITSGNSQGMQHFIANCTPGYFNNEGKYKKGMETGGTYRPGATAWAKVLESWREGDEMVGLKTLTH